MWQNFNIGREEVNLYLDGLLSLETGNEEAVSRRELIEVALTAETLPQLIAEWLWVRQLGMESALRVKLWFGLSYRELADVYGLSIREIGQLIRNIRTQELGTYPNLQDSQASGISCFMVEQNLSLWVDGEWDSYDSLPRLQCHLEECPSCYQRLIQYRKLHERILGERREFEEISELEWAKLRREIQRIERKTRIRWALILSFSILLGVLLFWAMFSGPDKTPNIYEQTEI